MEHTHNSENTTDGFNLLLDALLANDLDTIYGLVGIPITDLARMAQAKGFRFYGFRHESNAIHAASIAGFLTQKPGIAMTVSGPGFLNGLVALANATVNCFPTIMISGSSEREIIDLQQGDYEELDQLNLARPYVKAAFRITHAEDIGIGVARAIRAAVSGRPGGVYLDIPAKLLGQVMEAGAGARSLVKVVDAAPAQLPSQDSVARALQVLREAKRPVILLGKGAAYAQADKAILDLVEKTGIPFLPMSMAKGLIPDQHELSASAARSFVLQQADTVLLVGARLNWLLSHGKGSTWGASAPKEWGNKRFIQMDIVPTEMDSNVAIEAPLVGDIGSCVEALLAQMGSNPPRADGAWVSAVMEKKQKNVAKMAENLAKTVAPMNFHGALRSIRDVLRTRPEIHLVNEGANTLDQARSIIDMSLPRHRLDSGTWGIMGIGLGYSVGAATIMKKPVVAVLGDSAFGFSGMEVETLCRYNLPVTVVIFNNNGIYRGTDVNLGQGEEVAPTVFVKDSRYEQMMQAFGGNGYYATTPDELTRCLEESIASGKPGLINAIIDEKAGTESGRIAHLNPQSSLKK